METRSESSAKRARESHQELDQYVKMPRLSSTDKMFLKELIRESEHITSEIITNSIRDSENNTSEVIKNYIRESEDKHFKFIENLIKQSEERILSVIDNVKSELNMINERVNKLEIKSAEFDDMKKQISELKKKVLKQENSVVAGSVRIAGIPYYDNENLHSIFQNICKSVNIPVPQIDSIYRLKKIYKNNKPYNPNDEVIVVKLQSPFEKNYLLKSIAKYRRENQCTLRLNHAGFESEQPIYINENLTPYNHGIFKEALIMRKNKRLKSTFTLRGLVYVKKFDTEDAILVESVEELRELFRV